MSLRALALFAFILSAWTIVATVAICPAAPFDGAKQPGDGGHRLAFSEDFVRYEPGKIYNGMQH